MSGQILDSDLGPCVLSTRGRNDQGYAVRSCGARGKRVRVYEHRYAYEQAYGPIPDGLVLDHLCHTRDTACLGGPTCLHRRCVNPTHLEVVEPAENARRGGAARATHCKQGHEFTPENTYRRPDSGRGSRRCRTCARSAMEAWSLAAPALADDDPRHGTLNGYNSYGCRRECCRSALREYHRRRKALKQVAA